MTKISVSSSARLSPIFSRTRHMCDGWDVDDQVLWDFAKANRFAIVTQDVDFAEMAALRGSPPKVIWRRAGNQSTAAISALLRRHAELIAAFENDDETACLEIH